jgi:hypothetical protein
VTEGNEEMPSDIQALRDQFPGWTFGTVWASAASGPDARRIWAVKGGLLFSAWTAEELAFDLFRQTGRGQGATAPEPTENLGPADRTGFRGGGRTGSGLSRRSRS